jgi:hypothetical protein
LPAASNLPIDFDFAIEAQGKQVIATNLRAAQIGASDFLPIFYRPAETGYGRTLTKIG